MAQLSLQQTLLTRLQQLLRLGLVEHSSLDNPEFVTRVGEGVELRFTRLVRLR